MGGTCSTYGERRGVYRRLVGNLGERDYLKDRGVEGMIISSGSGMWEQGVNRSESGQGQVADTCKRGNEPSGS